MLNPRKILARCEVRIECTVYAKDELVWFDALSEECESVHIHTAARQIDIASLVSEKTFTVSDELAMPPGKPAPGTILTSCVSLRADDNQVVGEKLIVKGTAISRMFYLPENGENLEYAVFETPFSMPLIETLLSHGVSVTACDRRGIEDMAADAEKLTAMGASLRLGPGYLVSLDFDVIFRTPGLMPFEEHLAAAKSNGRVVTSEMEAFFQVCP